MPESVDVLIVGGGMGGLSAGALLARKGLRVALFEKHSKLGGYAQYFGHEPTWDSATHLIGGLGPQGLSRQVLEEAGALERIELIALDPVYHAIFPEQRYLAPADPERFRQELSALWPAEAEGIRRLFTEIESLGREYLSLRGTAPGPLMAKHHVRTLGGFLGDFTRDEQLRAALSALWLFAGLPPGRLSVLQYALLWQTMHVQGAAAVKGGVKNLSQALADVITGNGGTVENRVRVAKILRIRGRVTGALLEDGREFQTRAVVSNASPADTFEELLSDDNQAAAGYPPLRAGFITSISAMQVHLLIDGPLELPARTTLLHTTTDLEDAFFDLQRSDPEYRALVISQLDWRDPERAPAGKHMLSLYTLAPYSRPDGWNAPLDTRRGPGYRTLPEYQALKEELGDAMVLRAEDVLPGLAARVQARKVGTPITMERYTFNTGGAAYGWAPIPEQAGVNAQGVETPFRGLYMAGAWTYPGGTVAGALLSGSLAARAILAEG